VLANSDRSQRGTLRVAARLSQQSQAAEVPDPAAWIAERARPAQALQRLAVPDREALRLVGWEELDLAGRGPGDGLLAVGHCRPHRARRRLPPRWQ
jgi:hypothetical protein